MENYRVALAKKQIHDMSLNNEPSAALQRTLVLALLAVKHFSDYETDL